ncbi:hypothetical protein RB195_022713 [Necator americanus]|uniref:DUF5641 domain-containing protein n=1 Tax=Necator americanus TaxID=51031 RepID=A0ABR1EG98_NECAM
MIITYPMEGVREMSDDADYHEPGEILQLQTRRQTEEALRSSYSLTEKFWKVWKEQYLTALREQHIRTLRGNPGTPKQSEPDQVVLIADQNASRNTWKIWCVTKVKANAGVIREAELMLPNRRTIRRPINQLIPLEFTGTSGDQEEPKRQEGDGNESREEPWLEPQQHEIRHGHDLRNRSRVNYHKLHHGTVWTNTSPTSTIVAQHQDQIDLHTSHGSPTHSPISRAGV